MRHRGNGWWEFLVVVAEAAVRGIMYGSLLCLCVIFAYGIVWHQWEDFSVALAYVGS